MREKSFCNILEFHGRRSWVLAVVVDVAHRLKWWAQRGLDLRSTAGECEQAGVRPGLIIQNNIANAVSGYPVVIVCAISSRIKGYPSTVKVGPSEENGLTVTSEVNTGQIINVAKNRLGRRYGRLSDRDMKKVDAKLAYMLTLGD